MKKTFILSAVAALLLSAVSVVVYVNNDKNQMDDLFKANVELLTNSEVSGKYTCETRLKQGDGKTFFCGTCDWVSGAVPTILSGTKSCTR